MPSEKFYITTSIVYLNAVPHLGYALELVQADVIARFQRGIGRDVFFLTGSDEHGAKITRSAEAAGVDPRQFVDEKAKILVNVLEKLAISNDDFIRTSDQTRHWPGAQKLWKKLADAGDIYKAHYRGLYCVGHEAFITEKDLTNGICILHKTKPEVIEEENYFFKLTKYIARIQEAIEKQEILIVPEFRKPEILNMLKEAEDVSFSRPSKDISWGVPVPNDATQTMYVWCDALSNYISALGYGSSDNSKFEKYWPADVHIIGKDIIRFHALIWPAMLMSAGLSVPKILFVHGFINIRGEKMSKSVGNVVDPMIVQKKYGTDALRFFLLHEISSFEDSDYTDERFSKTYDGLLVKGIGNLLSRTAKMMSVFPEISKVTPEASLRYPFKVNLEKLTVDNQSALEGFSPAMWVQQVLEPAYHKHMELFELNDAIKDIWELFHMLDQYIEEYKIYKMIKENPEESKIALWQVAYAFAFGAHLLKPFLPETSEKIFRTLDVVSDDPALWTSLRAGEPTHLFPKIE